MKYLIKNKSELMENERRRLYELTNWNSSDFRDILNSSDRKAWIIMGIIDEKIIGWAKIEYFTYNMSRAVEIGVYVEGLSRRHGYGSKILKRAEEYALENLGSRKIMVCPWNFRSNSFYKSNNYKIVYEYNNDNSGYGEKEMK